MVSVAPRATFLNVVPRAVFMRFCPRRYRAPELLLRSCRFPPPPPPPPHALPSFLTSHPAASYGPSSDVWAAGVIMAELLALAPLFPGNILPSRLLLCRQFASRRSQPLHPSPLTSFPSLSQAHPSPTSCFASLECVAAFPFLARACHATVLQVLGPARGWDTGTRLAAAAGAYRHVLFAFASTIAWPSPSTQHAHFDAAVTLRYRPVPAVCRCHAARALVPGVTGRVCGAERCAAGAAFTRATPQSFPCMPRLQCSLLCVSLLLGSGTP
jgi:hypothetical protein